MPVFSDRCILAEMCRSRGLAVALVTPATRLSAWTTDTLEWEAVHKRLVRSGIAVVTSGTVTAFRGDYVEIAEHLPKMLRRLPAVSIVTVRGRLPREALHKELTARPEALDLAGVITLQRMQRENGRRHGVVERTPAWLNRFRRPAIRYERRADIHEAFVLSACAPICLNQSRRSCWMLLAARLAAADR